MAKLKATGFDYLVAEAMLRQSLMVPSEKTLSFLQPPDKWSWYKNPKTGKLSHKHRIPDPPQFPLCSREIFFTAMYCKMDVSTMVEGVLYRSSMHNGALFDCMLVCHRNFAVYVFQSSNLAAKVHNLDYHTIKAVMDGLEFDKNPSYKLVYVYCSDSSKPSESACNITNKTGVSAEDVAFVDSRMDIKIARVPYFPKAVVKII